MAANSEEANNEQDRLFGRRVLVLLRGHFKLCGTFRYVDVQARTLTLDEVEFVGRNTITQTNDSITLHSLLILDLQVLPENTTLEQMRDAAFANPNKVEGAMEQAEHEGSSTTAANEQTQTTNTNTNTNTNTETNKSATSSSPPTYIVVDTEERLEQVAVTLFATGFCDSGRIYAVDCEGIDLGAEGPVTVLQLATPEQIYIFDILLLGESAFAAGLRAILESPTCVKITHDCRKDSASLFHQHNVRLQNVFDGQVADLFIRRVMTGLMPGYVKGYAGCLKSYLGFSDEDLAVKDVGKALMSDPNIWAKRPMTKELLDYASFDVLHMFKLREVMMKLLWFDFDVATQKYLDTCRDDGLDTAHIVPHFQSGVLRHMLRNMSMSAPVQKTTEDSLLSKDGVSVDRSKVKSRRQQN